MKQFVKKFEVIKDSLCLIALIVVLILLLFVHHLSNGVQFLLWVFLVFDFMYLWGKCEEEGDDPCGMD